MVETSLVLDKVCIRYKYDGSATAQEEYAQLYPYSHSVKEGSLGKAGKVWKSSKAALTSTHLPIGKGGLFIRYGYVHKAYWSWIEFNPSRLNADDWADIAGSLSLLFTHGASTLLQKGRVARLDVAYDAQHASPQDYLFLDGRLRVSCHAYADAGSVYIGSAHGKKTVLVYDKAKEQLEKAGIAHDHGWLRIESRICDPARWNFTNIEQLKNPFSRFLVIDRQAWNASTSPALQELRSVVGEGAPIDLAFWGLSPADRKQAWTELSKCRAAWWDPDLAWQGYKDQFHWINPLLGVWEPPVSQLH